jgi:hypothetical protein
MGGSILLLCASGAMAGDLEDCRNALGWGKLDVAIVACDKAVESASTPLEASMARTLRDQAEARRMAARELPKRDEPIDVDPSIIRDPETMHRPDEHGI